jgi:dTMP kinase
MYKKRPIFITFEGIEGSGKSYQSNKLFLSIKSKKLPVILTREPGGTKGAEKIREIILRDYFYSKPSENFDKYTDTLLYLAARNEHIKNKIKPAILKKKIVLCDRFVDSTIAYQVYGKNVDIKLVDMIHKYILQNTKPDLTFLLKVNISKAMSRLNKRKKKNRYDKFSRLFYLKVQNAFIKIAKKNPKRYFVIDNSNDSSDVEKIIFDKFITKLSK